MTAPAALRVRLDPRDAVSTALQRSVLASVPGRFLITDAGAADVIVVSGRDPGWPDDVARAVDDGARGVLVVRPGLVDPAPVRALAGAVAGRAVVAVDTPYANDRTWTTAAGEVATDAARASIVDSVVSVAKGDPAGALVDQLAVVAGLVSLDGLRLVHRGAREYLLAAQTAGSWVTLAGVTSGTGRTGLAVDVVGPARRWQVRFDGTTLAYPTEVVRYDETGAHTCPLIYESGHRVTWQRLHEALAGTGTVGWSLDDLADALAVARDVLA